MKYVLLSLIALFAPLAALAEPKLVMVEQNGCTYCAMWDAQIAPAYPKTTEGKFAPLMRVDIRDTLDGKIKFDRRVNFTPTFVLVNENTELARIEGYPGEDFFWPLLSKLLEDNTDFQGTQIQTN